MSSRRNCSNLKIKEDEILNLYIIDCIMSFFMLRQLYTTLAADKIGYCETKIQYAGPQNQ